MAMDAISRILNKGRSDEAQDQVIRIELDRLRPNPFQPRKQFDPIKMDELSRSIAGIGVIQPIIVRQDGDQYEIVAGERRWRAAKLAGQVFIPAIVRNFTDRELAEIALVENLQRTDLSYFEEAEGYRRLIEEFNITQEEVAAKVGKSQPTIANKLRILKIDPVVKENIMVELLTERHVRALLRLRTVEEQLSALKEIYEHDLNVKDTEQLITDYLEGRTMMADPDADAQDEEDADPKRQTVRRIFSDMRIYFNTIKAAVATIQASGVDAKLDQVETDEAILISITIPKHR